eukprot:ctg_1010.g332
MSRLVSFFIVTHASAVATAASAGAVAGADVPQSLCSSLLVRSDGLQALRRSRPHLPHLLWPPFQPVVRHRGRDGPKSRYHRRGGRIAGAATGHQPETAEPDRFGREAAAWLQVQDRAQGDGAGGRGGQVCNHRLGAQDRPAAFARRPERFRPLQGDGGAEAAQLPDRTRVGSAAQRAIGWGMRGKEGQGMSPVAELPTTLFSAPEDINFRQQS